jgi:hypothetical protein
LSLRHHLHAIVVSISVLGSACAVAHDSPQGESVAKVDVLLTDAPGDFDEVWVDLSHVEIETDGGWLMLAEDAQSFDLLTLQDDVTAALGGGLLAPGRYNQLRLVVDSAHVVIDGATEPLTIASGSQTGVKIDLDAEIEGQMTYKLVIDFDAAKSVKHTGQGWLMTPVVTVKELAGEPMAPTTLED